MINYTVDINYILSYYSKVRINRRCLTNSSFRTIYFDPIYSKYYRNFEFTEPATAKELLLHLLTGEKHGKQQ